MPTSLDALYARHAELRRSLDAVSKAIKEAEQKMYAACEHEWAPDSRYDPCRTLYSCTKCNMCR